MQVTLPKLVWLVTAFALAWGITHYGARYDRWLDIGALRKLKTLSGAGILAYVGTMSFASFDWGMSLEPHWFSTIYGVHFVVGQGLSTLCLAIFLAARISRHEPFSRWFEKSHFHDLGNLNFSFITSGKEGELVDYKKHTAPVIEALGQLGLKVRMGSRNELLLGAFKISGTASHVFKQRALHHGTLLYSTDLSLLEGALKVREGSYQDRAVRSVRSEVCNLVDHLEEPMEIEAFEGGHNTQLLSA